MRHSFVTEALRIMLRSTLAVFSMLAILTLTFAGPATAQTKPTKQEEKTAKVKEKIRKLGLGERVKLKVKLYDKTKYEGYVKEASDNDFVVIDKVGNPHIIRYSDVDSVGGKNLSTGAKIGIGIGIGVGATIGFTIDHRCVRGLTSVNL